MEQIFIKIIPTDVQKINPLKRLENEVVRTLPGKIKNEWAQVHVKGVKN